MVVCIAVMDAATVSDHRMIEQRPLGLLDRIKLIEKVSELLRMENIDLTQLGLLAPITAVVR